MNKRKDILESDVARVLTRMTIPMIFGILGIVAFNLADTYFVGKLGTTEIAALTFTFPVVLIVNSINLGLGVGTSAIISRAIGQKNNDRVKRLSTDSLILSVIIAILFFIIGEITIEPVFDLLGADSSSMVFIKKYMRIWYAGSPFIVIPMVGNSIIRALGDTKTPSLVMMFSAGVNIVLDPIMIFGFGLIPAMGVTGAALATLISRAITMIFSLYVLIVREKVLSYNKVTLKEIFESWKEILKLGIPNAIAKMIIPLGTGVITGMISSYGTEVVAGYGIASRVEFLALAVVSAVSSIMPVFVGQNYGAGNHSRIIDAVRKGNIFSIIFGIITWLTLWLSGGFIASLFTANSEVSTIVMKYLFIVPLGYTFQGVNQIIIGAFNGTMQAVKASGVNLVQMFIVYIPLAKILSSSHGFIGILVAIVISQILVGVIAHIVFEKSLVKNKELSLDV
ncbi:MAG: MATE family efflux transporter [Firmicutes bacterium]|jgi:putative MATE family efflux protein|nr:MATE family efflux transporter [Bacillota bacterium]